MIPIRRCHDRLATEVSWNVSLPCLHFSPFRENVEAFSIAHSSSITFIRLKQTGPARLPWRLSSVEGEFCAVRRSGDLREANGPIEPRKVAVHLQRIMASPDAARLLRLPPFTAILSLHILSLASTG
jgi:hypothetical protein